eukprot:gene678-2110_t
MNPTPRVKLAKSPLQMLDLDKVPPTFPMPTIVSGMNSGTTIDGQMFNIDSNPNDSPSGIEEGDSPYSLEQIKEAIRMVQLAPTRSHVNRKRLVSASIGSEQANSRALRPMISMRRRSYQCTGTAFDAQALSSMPSYSV